MCNKSLLNALEQYVLNQHSVQILMGILEQRINYDKETLFQFTQLRKEVCYTFIEIVVTNEIKIYLFFFIFVFLV